MNPKRQTGIFIPRADRMEFFETFEPKPLPPDPPIFFDDELLEYIERANRAVGNLNGITSLSTLTLLFTPYFLKKEALYSSQIAGNDITFFDLLASENDDTRHISTNIQQILDYVTALQHGISVLKGKIKFELEEEIQNFNSHFTIKLLTDLHGILLENSKEEIKQLGKFRESQKWIGSKRPSKATYVPPQWEKVIPDMESLVDFWNGITTATLMKTALVHAQFETIHPFESGNGRLGRLLIPLLICSQRALNSPVLYLSLYLKKNREEYFERLQRIRVEGDWEGWLKFFFKGVLEISEQTATTVTEILETFESDQRRIESASSSKTTLRIQEFLKTSPIVSIKRLSKSLNLSVPSATSGLQQLERLGIVLEVTGNSRNRLFAYKKYLNLLSD